MKFSVRDLVKKKMEPEKNEETVFLSKDQEDLQEKNLIWIFAYRRSGTTWLANELLSHNTRFMDEPLLGLHIGRTQLMKKGIQSTFEIQKHRNDYFFAEEYQNTWKFYLRKLILNRIYSQFHDLTHKIVIKEPTGSYGADILASCLPNSKIIIMLRDGRDVMDSVLDALKEGGWENEKGHITLSLKNRIEKLQVQCNHWNFVIDCILKAYEFHNKDRRLILKYEDLRKDTLNELKKNYNFCQIQIGDETLKQLVEKSKFENIPQNERGSGKFKRFASPGKWKENFTDEETKIIENIIGNTLQKLGY